MLKKLQRWIEAIKLARTAREILADPQANIDAIIAMQRILIGLAERKPICRHCFKPFEVKERTFAERFQVRSILMIPDKELDPMLCDECFVTALSVYNPQATNIGTSNSGPANMVLKKMG